MSINYLEYFKYKVLLQSRRKLYSMEKFLKKFFPSLSYEKILAIWILKYIFETIAVSVPAYFIFEKNIQITKEILFPILILYLIIYSMISFAKNYNKIINPEDKDFLKVFPISNIKYIVLISIDSFLFCIVGSFFKRIFQLYIPCILLLDNICIFRGLLLIILLLYISFSLAIAWILIKYLTSKDKVSNLKLFIYLTTCGVVYMVTKKIAYYSIKILSTFPYESLANKDVNNINDWISIINSDIYEKFIGFVNRWLLNTYSPIANIKGIVFGNEILLNSFILTTYTVILTVAVLELTNYVKRENSRYTVVTNDLVSIFKKIIILVTKKYKLIFKKIDTSIYNIIVKDLKIFNNDREIINSKFFNIFGGVTIWVFFSCVSAFKDIVTASYYIKFLNIVILFFLPLFASLHFHEKLIDSFKFIFFIDGEGRNINIFKITGYPMEKLFKSKKTIFFIFSFILYATIFFSYIIVCKLNLEESIILLFNLICIYYFGCNFYMIGSLLNSDFSWNHIDDQGNSIGQRYISNTLMTVFAFFYSINLVVFSILYVLNKLKMMFFIYLVMILILYYINKFILKKSLRQINNIVNSEEV